MHELDTLYEICEILSRELDEANEKIRKAGGKLSAGDLEVVDKLTHAMKSVKTTIAMIEADGDYSNDYDGMDGSSMNRRSYGRTNYNRGNSYARGRTGNVRRDSMGRYSRDEAEDEMLEAMEDYLKVTTDPTKKAEIERFMKKISR